ncbi:GNAT family N-acetyltransferase [Ewingella americana]|uniref:GNAT family N-acetyltransferase n=1 Tax=Ewingella americana TaxID=41202 RepID=UPI001F22B591|nr:GNAT family N-acetyltransferase [Ewingella americana]
MTTLAIRDARASDAAELARLHVAVWRETYRELAPAEAFAALDEGRRLAFWQDKFANPAPGQFALLAEIDGQLVGFTLASESSNPQFGEMAEIKLLYVDTQYARQGIGRCLLTEIAQRLKKHGFTAAGLGVVVGNQPAINFYTALGGQEAGRYTDSGPLWLSDNLIYAWQDINQLLPSR